MNLIINTLILKFKNMPKLYNIMFIILIYIIFFAIYSILYIESYKEINIGIIYFNNKKSNEIIEFLEKHLDANIIFYNDENLLKKDILTKKINIGYIIKPCIESSSSDYKKSITIYKRESETKNYIVTEILRASITKLILNEIISNTLNNKIENNKNINKILALTYLNTSFSNFEKNIYNINDNVNTKENFLCNELEIQQILQMLISLFSFFIILYNYYFLISKEEMAVLNILKLNIKSIKIYHLCNIIYTSILSIILLIFTYYVTMFLFNLDENFIIKMFFLSLFYSFNIASLCQIVYLVSSNKFTFCIFSFIILFFNIIIGCKYINIPFISSYKIFLQVLFPINNFIFNLDNIAKYIIISIFQNILYLYIINKKIELKAI